MIPSADKPLAEESVPTQTQPGDVVPHVGRPLDGSEYLDVVEEQAWANRRPAADGRNQADECAQEDGGPHKDPPGNVLAVGKD